MLVYGSYIHRGPKSGCKMVTLFDSYSYDGVSAGIWVIHTGPKSGGQTLACILSKMCYYIPSFMIGYCDYDV